MQQKLWNKQTLLTLGGILALFAGLVAFFYYEGLAGRPIYLFAIIVIAVIVAAIAAVYLYLLSKGKIHQTDPDYRSLFFLGLMFFIFGSSENPTFYVIGIIFVAAALANKKKWKPEMKWNEMSPVQKNLKIAALVILFLLVIGGFVMWYLGSQNKSSDGSYTGQVTNFEDCVAAGNPVMESYPRQCRHMGEIYVEEIEPSLISEQEARTIAQSACIKGGESVSGSVYNSVTKTWWFDANLNVTRDGCNPACVVNEETKTAEINWQCTGLIPE